LFRVLGYATPCYVRYALPYDLYVCMYVFDFRTTEYSMVSSEYHIIVAVVVLSGLDGVIPIP
jgi:hypothetical protein